MFYLRNFIEGGSAKWHTIAIERKSVSALKLFVSISCSWKKKRNYRKYEIKTEEYICMIFFTLSTVITNVAKSSDKSFVS